MIFRRKSHTRKVLLQCPQETRAPDGCGSGLAGPGWTEPRLIILLLETQTRKVNMHSLHSLSLNTMLLISSWRWSNSKGTEELTGTFWEDSLLCSLIATNGTFSHAAPSELANQTAARGPACWCQHVCLGCKAATAFCSPEQFDVIQVACGWVVATLRRQETVEILHCVFSTTSKLSESSHTRTRHAYRRKPGLLISQYSHSKQLKLFEAVFELNVICCQLTGCQSVVHSANTLNRQREKKAHRRLVKNL